MRRVIKSQLMPLGEAQGCVPRLLVGLEVDLNRQLPQIGKRSVTKVSVMTLASYTHLQNISHFQTPESWNPCAALTEQIEDLRYGLSRLVAVRPSQRDGTVENQAHRIRLIRSGS